VPRSVSASWAREPAGPPAEIRAELVPKHAFAPFEFPVHLWALRACPRDPHLHWRDPASGYELVLGRRKARDPAGFVDGPNLYAYVGNRPLVLVDPTGLAACCSKSFVTCFANCVGVHDPFNRAYTGRFGPGPWARTITSTLGFTFPKSWLGFIGVRATGLAGSSRITTLPSLLANLTGLRALRLVGRVFSPIFVTHGLYLAAVESMCAGQCLGDRCAY